MAAETTSAVTEVTAGRTAGMTGLTGGTAGVTGERKAPEVQSAVPREEFPEAGRL